MEFCRKIDILVEESLIIFNQPIVEVHCCAFASWERKQKYMGDIYKDNSEWVQKSIVYDMSHWDKADKIEEKNQSPSQ